MLPIPRGGVETACYVADYLHAELSLVVTRKLGYPENPEAAFGAQAEDGSYYIFITAKTALMPDSIQSVVAREEREIERRVKVLRGGMALPAMKDRIVIIVDDGIATGATIFATITLCKSKGARHVVVATPVAGESTAILLQSLADDVIILRTPPYYYAVSQEYHSFSDLTDDEVIAFLRKGKREPLISRMN